MKRSIIITSLLILALAPLTLAHDFWIVPSAFQTPLNTLVRLDLRFGDGYPGESFPRSSQRIEKFVVVGPDGVEQPVLGREGQQPAGIVRFPQPGLYLVGYRSKAIPVELEGAKFDQYLREKGLEKILEIRRGEGSAHSKVKEIFSRCAKAIIAAGDVPSSDGIDLQLGLRLELVPERSPLALRPGESFPVRLFLDGKPAADRLLIATSPGNPGAKVIARTDELGRAALSLPTAGVWVVNAVEMLRAPADSGADWESLWASLSFETTDPTAMGNGAVAPR